MNKPKKSLRVWEITAWHSAGFSPHAGPHVRTHQCEHFLFIHMWTFSAGPAVRAPQCGPARPHAPVWMHLKLLGDLEIPSKGYPLIRTICQTEVNKSPVFDVHRCDGYFVEFKTAHADGDNQLKDEWNFQVPFTKESNTILVNQWDVITHPCPDFNAGLDKPPLKLGTEWDYVPHRTVLFVHVLIAVNLC